MKSPGLWLAFLALTGSACQPVTTTPTTSTIATVLPTSTSTMAPTPSPIPPTGTATSTALPPPRLFSEDFNAGASYWSFRQVKTGQPDVLPVVEAGSLLFRLASQNQWVMGLYDPHEYTDVRVDARVRLGEGAASGVICRYDEERGWYEFNILDDRTYVLLYGQWLTDGVARYTPLVQTESEKILPAENEIGLACEGDTLTPFINGTQLRRRQETLFGLTRGRIGVAVSSFENAPAIIAYDWVKVEEP